MGGRGLRVSVLSPAGAARRPGARRCRRQIATWADQAALVFQGVVLFDSPFRPEWGSLDPHSFRTVEAGSG